jgi:TfoX/Sxy family transcriptional regulator of competence genes
MFGGLSFLLNGNMCCGVVNDLLVLRLGEDGAAEALAEPHTQLMDFTGKPMKSMVYVTPDGSKADEALQGWVQRAVAYASSLPAKGG